MSYLMKEIIIIWGLIFKLSFLFEWKCQNRSHLTKYGLTVAMPQARKIYTYGYIFMPVL